MAAMHVVAKLGERDHSQEEEEEDQEGGTHENDIVRDGSIDLRGRAVRRSRTGGWKASSFIIAMELAERIAFYGIASNLVQYLTFVLKEDLVDSVKNTNNWVGVTTIVPFIGGFVADAYLGRYVTVGALSIIYVLGMAFLSMSTTIDALKPPCIDDKSKTCPTPTSLQVGFFYMALYMVSIGTGGVKPCLEALGADQFDEEDPIEKKNKSSFFNWWYFGISTGGLFSVTVLVYIQTNVGWNVGFGVPTGAMVVAILLFFLGTPFYRHKPPGGSPLTRIAQVLVASLRNHKMQVPTDERLLYEGCQDYRQGGGRQLQHSKQFRFLDKAAILDNNSSDMAVVNPWKLSTITNVEEVKLLLRIMPIWLTAFTYGLVFAQSITLFTKQGNAMNGRIGHFQIPAASFQAITPITVLITLIIYDLFLVRRNKGITMLQRIGVGIFFSLLCMLAAALIEARRLHSLGQVPPISILWLLPQYVLIGLADAFTLVGHQEFFYDQMPDSMRSLGMALYLGAIGVGNFLSSFLILIIQHVTNRHGSKGWFGPTINSSRIDYFYWLLLTLSTLNFIVYIFVAHFYIYKKPKSASINHSNNGLG